MPLVGHSARLARRRLSSVDLAGVPPANGLSAGADQGSDCRPGQLGRAGLAHGLDEVAFGLRALHHRRPQRRDRRIELVTGVRLVVLEPCSQLVGVLQDLLNAAWRQ